MKNKQHWKTKLKPFEKSHTLSSLWQILNTIIPFFILWYLAYLSLGISLWLTLLIAAFAGGFLIRTFIIFHDCCHYSFFQSRKANEIMGFFTGILTCVPYEQWKYTHTRHHATSGNLTKRGVGDIWTLTVEEYVSSSWLRRFFYRTYRNPAVMFGLGPIIIFLLDYRFNRPKARLKERINTYLTNLGIVGWLWLLGWLIGWQALLLVQGPIFFISGVAGIWLFYVQHQFEHSYFEKDEHWDYARAAMDGSSYYKLPKLLQWLTGNIGYHHIHHLSPRVPNYYLEQVHKSDVSLRKVQTIGLWSSFKSLRYRLWNEQTKEFVAFNELKPMIAARRKSSQ